MPSNFNQETGMIETLQERYAREEAEMANIEAANARLIDAAPELLEVAQSILADDMLQYLPAEYIAKVSAAIAKATGSQA